METTRPWLEESNITDDLIAFVQQNSSESYRKSVGGPSDAYVELLNTVVKPRITMVGYMYGRGFGPLQHLWEKSKMVVGEFLRLHKSKCLASELPRLLCIWRC